METWEKCSFWFCHYFHRILIPETPLKWETSNPSSSECPLHKYEHTVWPEANWNMDILPFSLALKMCVCFYVGVVWPLKAGANSSSYNETSPVLISYLSTNSGSGSGGSLCLIASLKSHKAVWHSQDANPSQLGHFWWGETSRGGKLQWLGGRKKKVHVKLSCRLVSRDANTPEAAELDPDPVAD